MKCIETCFRVATPCFTGPEDGKAELRLPSIKGVLRFWWRAWAYAAFIDDDDGNCAVRRLRRCENDLFGSSETGQGRLAMRLDTATRPRTLGKGNILRDEGGKRVGPGARYLGYGVMEAFARPQKGTDAGQLIRPCLEAPFEFALRIGAKDEVPLRQVEPALRLLGLAGGLGARARKGYGSLNLISLQGDGVEDWRSPETIDDYREQLASLLGSTTACDREPEFSAFSSHTRVDLLSESHAPLKVLDDYGRAMVRYRSWGRNGKILDKERSRQKFREDHDWMKGDAPDTDFHPRRAVFGLPHNYGKGIEVKPKNYGRRASPLLFHVHRIGERYAGIAFLLRARFLPGTEKILARDRAVPAKPDWSVLTDFLDENSRQRLWPDD